MYIGLLCEDGVLIPGRTLVAMRDAEMHRLTGKYKNESQAKSTKIRIGDAEIKLNLKMSEMLKHLED